MMLGCGFFCAQWRSINHNHRVLHSALKYAVRCNFVPLNVTKHVDPPKVGYRSMNILDEKQTIMFKALRDSEIGTMVDLDVNMGFAAVNYSRFSGAILTNRG